MSRPDYTARTRKTFAPIFEILQHYECHPVCAGECCRDTTITISRSERKHLMRKYPHARKVLSDGVTASALRLSHGIATDQYTLKDHPCPFLSGTRCSIHMDSPLVCQTYPFTVNKGEPPGYIAIMPCPMGLDIMKDYTVMNIVYNGDDDEFARTDLERLRIVLEDAKTRPPVSPDNDTKIMFVPFSNLEAFAHFLQTSTPEHRLSEWKRLGIE